MCSKLPPIPNYLKKVNWEKVHLGKIKEYFALAYSLRWKISEFLKTIIIEHYTILIQKEILDT